jgi:hypothetical protein
VTFNSTRKQFFSKLLGVVAAAGVWPKLAAKPEGGGRHVRHPTTAGRKPSLSFEVRTDARAVARRDVV